MFGHHDDKDDNHAEQVVHDEHAHEEQPAETTNQVVHPHEEEHEEPQAVAAESASDITEPPAPAPTTDDASGPQDTDTFDAGASDKPGDQAWQHPGDPIDDDTADDSQEPLKGQEILVEFGDPNPFKEMHIGHVYSYIVGDSIARLLEVQGARVHRLSYHGDVGLHIAKAIWGMQKEEAGPSADSIGSYYAKGVYERLFPIKTNWFEQGCC